MKNKTAFFAFGFLLSLMSIFTLLLFHEYNALTTCTQDLLLLQDEYCQYVEIMKNVLDRTTSNEGTGGHEDGCNGLCCQDDAFVVINRESDYLKQSMLEYLKEQQLDELLTRIDVQAWQDYNDQVIKAKQKPIPKLRAPRQKTAVSRPTKKKQRQIKRRTDLRLIWPVERKKFWLSSLFGPRKRRNGTWRFHYGIDMAALKGTHVNAAADGKVIEARYAPGYGNTIVIVHSRKYKTRYAHLNKIRVKKGQRVRQGKHIGDVGDTGFTIKSGKDASHLHFEVYEGGKQVNPLQFLP